MVLEMKSRLLEQKITIFQLFYRKKLRLIFRGKKVQKRLQWQKYSSYIIYGQSTNSLELVTKTNRELASIDSYFEYNRCHVGLIV